MTQPVANGPGTFYPYISGADEKDQLAEPWEVLPMHMLEPDLVSIKTAMRQLATRLENEAVAAEHWASLARNRGVEAAAVRLDVVVTKLKEAYASADAATERLVEAQEQAASHEHGREQ